MLYNEELLKKTKVDRVGKRGNGVMKIAYDQVTTKVALFLSRRYFCHKLCDLSKGKRSNFSC